MDYTKVMSRPLPRLKTLLMKTLLLMFVICHCLYGSEGINECPAGCKCSNSEVNCSFSIVSVFPTDIPSSSVTELHLSYGSQLILKADFLPYLPFLKTLVITHSQLTNVEFNPVNIPSLEELDLSYNLLEKLPVGLPGQLHTLLLSHNKISSLHSSYLNGLIHLRELFLDHNQLRELNFNFSITVEQNDHDKLVILPSLEKVALNYNHIKNIDDNFFKGLVHLKTLSLDSNKIKIIKAKSFKNLFHLTHLDLSQNLLNNIHNEAFVKLKNLEYLDLHNNRLLNIPTGLPMMEWLDLSYNSIRTVSQDISAVLLPINTFNMGHNPFHCDCHLKWLKELYVRREYIIKHLTIDKSDFIPYCNSPDSLAGKTWDVLEDDMFVCDNESLSNNNNENKLNPLDFSVKIGTISDTFIHIEWKTKTKSNFKNVFIQYYRFGERKKSLKHVEISAVQKEFRIKHLTQETNYVVCIIPRTKGIENAESAVPLSYNHCVEVTTSVTQATDMGSYFWIFCYYMLGMAGTIIFLITAIGLVALACSFFVPKGGEWSAKYVPVIDEPVDNIHSTCDADKENLHEVSSQKSALRNRTGDSVFNKQTGHGDSEVTEKEEEENYSLSEYIAEKLTTKQKVT